MITKACVFGFIGVSQSGLFQCITGYRVLTIKLIFPALDAEYTWKIRVECYTKWFHFGWSYTACVLSVWHSSSWTTTNHHHHHLLHEAHWHKVSQGENQVRLSTPHQCKWDCSEYLFVVYHRAMSHCARWVWWAYQRPAPTDSKYVATPSTPTPSLPFYTGTLLLKAPIQSKHLWNNEQFTYSMNWTQS